MSDAFATGQRLGDYEILGVLGAGGMGTVYKVRNVISDRIEAMKVLLANLASQKELADRFQREIKLLASLDHPNIAALRTALTLDNQLVMMMEYVEGVTLAARLEQRPIPVADAVNYTTQVLGALSYAHKLNVIHRDIKPANMMLTPQGVVKLMDFGIARPNNEAGMTVTGTTLGSLNYMPPEQVMGEPVDARSDLYSLGISLYEMTTGQLPFRGNSNYSVMSAHLKELPKPPINLRSDLPGPLNDIILMAMAKEPEKRFQSAEAFGNALKSALPEGVTLSSGANRVATQPLDVRPIPMPTIPSAAPAMQPPVAAGAQPNSHRGLYMALGGLLVFVGLVVAGFYLPRKVKTQASTSSTNSDTSAPAQPSAQPVSQPATPPPPPAADNQPANPPAAHSQDDSAAQQEQIAAAKKAQEEAAEEAKRKAAEFAEAEKQDDQLTSRAAAVSQSLDNLRRAQSSQGYGLRGDITAAEELMKTNLARGQSALDQKDGAKAKTYLDMAEAQVEKLERFLGR